MPYAFVLYPTPLDAHAKLTPDGQPAITAVPYTDPAGRPGQVAYVPDVVTSGHGAELTLDAPGYLSTRVRGFLGLYPIHPNGNYVARLEVDDYMLTAAPQAPPDGGTPPPSGPRTPVQIMDEVYRTTNPNLATVEGCGKYTEDCCDALHAEHSEMWGHIRKNPGQNQYQGHAVDAIMLLTNVSSQAGNVQAGIYDIIFSSASFEAKPVFNFVEPPHYELWYYPADAATMGVKLVALPLLRKR